MGQHGVSLSVLSCFILLKASSSSRQVLVKVAHDASADCAKRTAGASRPREDVLPGPRAPPPFAHDWEPLCSPAAALYMGILHGVVGINEIKGVKRSTQHRPGTWMTP